MAMNPRLLRPLASGFNPRQIAGLQLWLDGADVSSQSLDGSGNVEQWNDKSGNSNHATQATANNRPTPGTAINGRRSITFDGTDDFMVFASGKFDFAATQPLTFFAVLRRTSDSGIGVLFGKQQSTGNATGYAITLFPTGTSPSNVVALALRANSTNQAWRNSAWSAAQDPVVLSIVYDGSSSVSGMDIWQDASEQAYITTGDNLTLPIANAVLASIGSREAGSLPLNATVGELFCYDRVLSATERHKVEGYLAWKWGLQSQLPYDHPYARSFPGFGSQATPTDSDALTYLAAVSAADGTGVEVGVANAVDDFVKGCKSDGIWDSIKASCILAGARTLAGALVPLVGTAPTNNNFVSGDYDRETGLVGNGSTKYLDTNRANDDDPVDDQHMAVWVHTAETSGNFGVYLGAGDVATGVSQFGRASVPATDQLFRCRAQTASFVVNQGGATGLIGMSRAAAGSYTARVGGSNTTFSVSSETASSDSILAYKRASAGETTARLAFYSIGEALDLEALDTRVSALITAIGNAI